MSQGTFHMRFWQKKLNKSTILSALSGSHVNKISTSCARDSKCNKQITQNETFFKHWCESVGSRDNIWKEARIHKLLTGGFVFPAASNKREIDDKQKK